MSGLSPSFYVTWLWLQMRQLTQRHDIPLIVDDRLDVALAVDADGLEP